MNTATSYLSRCQQWLDSGAAISRAELEQTIAKFTRRLDSGQVVDDGQQQDLQDTLALLHNHWVELVGPDGGTLPVAGDETVPSCPPASASPTADNAGSELLDFTPLIPPAENPVPLSAEEKQQRLTQLLASGRVSKGVSNKPR